MKEREIFWVEGETKQSSLFQLCFLVRISSVRWVFGKDSYQKRSQNLTELVILSSGRNETKWIRNKKEIKKKRKKTAVRFPLESSIRIPLFPLFAFLLCLFSF